MSTIAPLRTVVAGLIAFAAAECPSRRGDPDLESRIASRPPSRLRRVGGQGEVTGRSR